MLTLIFYVMENLGIVLLSMLFGGALTYIIIRPVIKKKVQYNQSLEFANKTLETDYKDRLIECDKLSSQCEQVKHDYDIILAKRDELLESLNNLKQSQTAIAEQFYQQALSTAEQGYEAEIERMSHDLDERRAAVNQEYTTLLQDAVKQYETQIQIHQQLLSDLIEQLKKEQQNVDLAVKQAQQRMAIESQQDYYRICLSDDDISEIASLRKVPLRDKTPINKVIYKVYYEKPLTTMIGRVVGTGVHTGIYKITNINNQMCYVGQAVEKYQPVKNFSQQLLGVIYIIIYYNGNYVNC